MALLKLLIVLMVSLNFDDEYLLFTLAMLSKNLKWNGLTKMQIQYFLSHIWIQALQQWV